MGGGREDAGTLGLRSAVEELLSASGGGDLQMRSRMNPILLNAPLEMSAAIAVTAIRNSVL